MTTLRALVGGSFVLIVIGLVISTPLVWALILGFGHAYPEVLIKGHPYQRKDVPVQMKTLPQATYEQSHYRIDVKQK
jgi:hypothetical protein